jgi:hypothetical protein
MYLASNMFFSHLVSVCLELKDGTNLYNIAIKSLYNVPQTCKSCLHRLTRTSQDGFFQKLLKAEAIRRVRMCNLQSAKDCASVETSLATVHARAQEMRLILRAWTYISFRKVHGPAVYLADARLSLHRAICQLAARDPTRRRVVTH